MPFTKEPKTVSVFICQKCFNTGSILQNKGIYRKPIYIHASGQCRPLNWPVMLESENVILRLGRSECRNLK